jgi:predicted RNase H-like HicB family nuclease
MDLGKTKTRSPAVAKIRPAIRYVVVVDGKPGAYGMYVPDMPGCYSMGDTIAGLLTNAQEALQLWAEDAIASKADLPEPRGIDEVRKDPGVARDLTEGGLLAVVPPLRFHRERGPREDRCGRIARRLG